MNEKIFELVRYGKVKEIAEETAKALEAGEDAKEILNTMIDAMAVVGDGFKDGSVFVPEMLIAAMTMQTGVEVLKPRLAEAGNTKIGKFIMGTVYGDLHDVGKNLVEMMVESAGFEVVDLGIDVPCEKFVEAVENDPEVNLVGVSALLTTTMPAMEAVVEALNGCKNRSQFKIMVGGAPITQAFCDKIGADCYTPDAATAAEMAKKLVS